MAGEDEGRGESGLEGAERVVGKDSLGFQHRKKGESEGGESRDEKMVMVKLIA
jgi:hypothetical protein